MIAPPAKLALLLCGALFALLPPGTARAQSGLQPVPPFEALVTDLTGTLTADQQAALDQKLTAFQARKGAQIAVLIVPTTQPEAIEQYSIRVVDRWQLGRAASDDGALLLIATEDRRLRIEVGRGLEGVLTDLVANRIIDETITPLLRQGSFAAGIDAGVEQMIRVIDGEALPPPDEGWGGRGGAQGVADILPFLFVAVFVGSMVLRSMFGRAFGSLATGGVTGFVAYAITAALGIAIGAGVAAFLFSLLLGTFGGGRWSSLPRHGGFGGGRGGFGGGGFGGGGFGGGGFGGGGGGSFGGGGASGNW